MSEWHVHIVKLRKLGSLPQLPGKQITSIYGKPIVVEEGMFQQGDFAVTIPPDSLLPSDLGNPLYGWNKTLTPSERVSATSYGKIVSNGLLVPAGVFFTQEELQSIPVMTSVADLIGVEKWLDQGDELEAESEGSEPDSSTLPTYTDMEAWQKYRKHGIINDGSPVVLTEKIHGASARYAIVGDTFLIGSRRRMKRHPKADEKMNIWSAVANNLDIQGKLEYLHQFEPTSGSVLSGLELKYTALFGEIYGKVQNLDYGLGDGLGFRVFDSYNLKTKRYYDWNVTLEICAVMGLEVVPTIYKGPWSSELEKESCGLSVLYPGHVREGFVVKPLKEFHNYYTHRTIFKFVGNDYKLLNKR